MSRQNRQTAASVSFASLLLFSIGATVFHGRSVISDNHSRDVRADGELFSDSKESVQQLTPTIVLEGDPLLVSAPVGSILSSPSDGALYIIKEGLRADLAAVNRPWQLAPTADLPLSDPTPESRFLRRTERTWGI